MEFSHQKLVISKPSNMQIVKFEIQVLLVIEQNLKRINPIIHDAYIIGLLYNYYIMRFNIHNYTF